MESLTYLLRELEDLPAEIGIDKPAKTKELFERYRQEKPLLEKAIAGEYSFVGAVEPLTQKHRGVRVFLPRIKDKVHDQRVEELKLEGLLSNIDGLKSTFDYNSAQHQYLSRAFCWFANKILSNPVGATFAMVASLLILNSDNNIPAWRLATGSAMAGGLVGSIGSFIRYDWVQKLRNDAQYLDQKIRTSYPLHSVTV